jgi:cysteine-rich repeat protein
LTVYECPNDGDCNSNVNVLAKWSGDKTQLGSDMMYVPSGLAKLVFTSNECAEYGGIELRWSTEEGRGTCGDAVLSVLEHCDDGNTADGDGCSADCSAVEAGYTCDNALPGSACASACGDGVLAAAHEECDYSNSDTDDDDMLATNGCNISTCMCTQSPCVLTLGPGAHLESVLAGIRDRTTVIFRPGVYGLSAGSRSVRIRAKNVVLRGEAGACDQVRMEFLGGMDVGIGASVELQCMYITGGWSLVGAENSTISVSAVTSSSMRIVVTRSVLNLSNVVFGAASNYYAVKVLAVDAVESAVYMNDIYISTVNDNIQMFLRGTASSFRIRDVRIAGKWYVICTRVCIYIYIYIYAF